MADSRMIIEDGIIAWFDGPEWDKVVQDEFESKAPNIEADARANAIWEDQTGAARAGLTATVQNDEGFVTLSLAHTVDYGIWLETIQSGRFAIIMSTLEQHYGPLFKDAAQAAFRARRGRNV